MLSQPVVHSYIKHYMHDMGIKSVSLLNNETPIDRLEGKTLALIQRHAETLSDYLFSQQEENKLPGHDEPMVMLSLIGESLLFAKAKQLASNTDSEILNIDPLIVADQHYIQDNLMGSVAPRVGHVFHPAMLKKSEMPLEAKSKTAQQMLARMGVTEALNGMNIDALKGVQWRLFFSDKSKAEVTDIILNDIKSRQNDALVQWSDQEQPVSHEFANTVHETFLRIYSSTMKTQFMMMKKSFPLFTGEEKQTYMQAVERSADGILIDRTRKAFDAILNEAMGQDLHVTHGLN